MRSPRYSLVAFCILLSAAFGGHPAAAAQDRVVVELFTSQGCPACPPADAFLRELAGRDDVIALEFHIDYYDYAGWIDPFGKPEFTRRWREYARAMGARYEYTPFMVIGGRSHHIGWRREPAEEQISRLKASAGAGPRLSVETAGDLTIIRVEGDAPAGLYDLLVATYDDRRETLITAGENEGRRAINAHVVRGFERVGQWAGEPVELAVSLGGMPGDGGCAVLLQRAGGGPILAAVEMSFDR